MPKIFYRESINKFVVNIEGDMFASEHIDNVINYISFAGEKAVDDEIAINAFNRISSLHPSHASCKIRDELEGK